MSGLSSLVFPSFAEESHDPVLSEGDVLPVRWTADMLATLDWRKLVEIARAVAVSAGCEPGATRISPDGSAEFDVRRGRGSGTWTERVHLAPWNKWMATGACIAAVASRLAGLDRIRGMYLAPGGFSPSAGIEAARCGIGTVDAAALAETLNGLPQEHSEFFHDVAMSGRPFVPTCPVCLRPLGRSEETVEAPADLKGLPDLCYRSSDIVAGTVLARRVEVLKGCEVHFLREVRARDVIVHGTVHGDFICEGSLLLNPGAVLCGHVASRSVLVRPGAELRGETRILKGDLGPLEKDPSGWMWRCANVPPKPGCAEVAFLPH